MQSGKSPILTNDIFIRLRTNRTEVNSGVPLSEGLVMIVADEEVQFLQAVDGIDVPTVRILLEINPDLIHSAKNIVGFLML
jgi:hypothetical protein